VLSKNSIQLENFGPQSWWSVAEHEPGMGLTAHSYQSVPSSRWFNRRGISRRNSIDGPGANTTC
jgi:hypothetical protein